MVDEKVLSKVKIQERIYDNMLGLFQFVVEEKGEYYKNNPDKIPDQHSIKKLISLYGNQNAAISGAVGLIPGPMGMAAAVPEIILILRNQIRMVYDIGVAYGKSDMMTKELLAGVFASSLGSGAIGLLTMHGSKVLVRRTSLRVFQKVVQALAGKVTQQALKSMISKWLPFIGAAAMSVWSKITTDIIGKKASEILSKEIEFVETETDEDADVFIEPEPIFNSDLITKIKIVALCNLMKIDGVIQKTEIEFIEELIKKSELDSSTVNELKEKLKSPDLDEIDFSVFPAGYIETMGMVIDLVALAKRDGEFHIAEKNYIMQIGEKVGFTKDEILSYMN
jgi:uncharacterized protein (DUF697 family)/uncharacterized tellurite resistance protein B-like protein